MSWKAVELQVALPRTQEAGKYQEQLSKQNQRFQESLAQSQLRQQELQKKRTNRFEKTRYKKVRDDEERSNPLAKREQLKENNKNHEETIRHPYLGRQVDITR